MQVEEELARYLSKEAMVLTIGVFDGVHIGHKYLISQLIKLAKEQNSHSGLITFRQHPLEVLSPETELSFLTNLDERINLLKKEGVEEVIALSFNNELARLSARQFVSLLKKYLNMCALVIGPDFALGKKREGNADALRELGNELGFSVTAIPPITNGTEVISSTAIRNALAKGNMSKVRNLLGRDFSIEGKVTSGEGRGTGLGFPTANIDMDPKMALPAEGVYATRAYIGNQVYQSMTNIGKRPTFGGNNRTIEVFLLDYENDLYGRELKIDVVERLRDEKRFDNVDDLKKQIAEDVARGKTVLNSQN